jgi:hypothetical protein
MICIILDAWKPAFTSKSQEKHCPCRSILASVPDRVKADLIGERENPEIIFVLVTQRVIRKLPLQAFCGYCKVNR